MSESPKQLDFVLAVRSRTGQTVTTPMSIQPQEKVAVDLRNLLTQLGSDPTGDFAEGSVLIYFNGTIMPLAGQLTMSNLTRSLVFESEVVDNSPSLGLLPPALHAVWWGIAGGRDARFMVSNTGGAAEAFRRAQALREAGMTFQAASQATSTGALLRRQGDIAGSAGRQNYAR